MTRNRTVTHTIVTALIMAALGMNFSPVGLWGMSAARAESNALRSEVGKPLQVAQELMKAKKYKEALSKLRELDAVANKTSFEAYMIERVRASIAAVAGDDELAIKSFEVIIASGRLQAGEEIQFMQALGGLYYRLKDYPKAISWLSQYMKAEGADPKMRPLLVQAYYLNNDFARAAQELRADLQANENAGRAPAQDQLQLLASCALKLNDQAAYTDVLEKFVTYFPKKEYWTELLNRAQSKPGFADRLRLDVYRLKLAIGPLNSAAEYMEISQLAMQTGFPAEANKIVEQGFQSGVLGAGADISRQQRLRDLVSKAAADDLKTMVQGEAEAKKSKDGTGLINLGYAYVSAGQFDRGVALMEQGIGKGGLKRTEDAKLHLALAYALAGQKPKAIQMFKTVQGADGAADLARYWVVQLNHLAH